MSIDTVVRPIEESVCTMEQEAPGSAMRWTRQPGGSYLREGTLPADISTVRIFSLDEDHKTNPMVFPLA